MEINWQNNNKQQYRLISCHKFQTETKVISKAQKLKLSSGKVDVRIDLSTGEGFIRPKKGKKIIDPKFGPEAWDLLERLIQTGGETLRLKSENHVSAKIWRLRKAFNDKDQYFFITQRHPFYSMRLNPKRTWQIIMEHVPQQEN